MTRPTLPGPKLGAVEDADDDDLRSVVADAVDDDVRQARQLEFTASQRCTGMSEKGEIREQTHCIADTVNDLCRCVGVALGDVFVKRLDIALCLGSVADPYRPHFFQSASISASVA